MLERASEVIPKKEMAGSLKRRTTDGAGAGGGGHDLLL
jgi:hypothetical protein